MKANLVFRKRQGVVVALLGLLATLGVLGVACESTPAKTAAPSTIVQVSQPGSAAAPAAPAAATGWQTEAAQKVGIKLLQTLDSSGPAAWDAQKHPLAFFTSNGPGYADLESAKVKLPGLTVIDAKTKEVITARWFDLGSSMPEQAAAGEPHSLGVSADGQWIYLPTVDVTAPADDRGRLMVIDAKTLKLHQVIGTRHAPHHSKILLHADGRKLMMAYDFTSGSGTYILDPQNDNKVVAAITDEDLGGRRYLAFADPKGENLYLTMRPPSGTELDSWVSVVSTKDWKEKKVYQVGPGAVWVTFTADGKYAFVTNPHDDTYTKIDTVKKEVVRTARTGASGPYGATLNWDETEIWFISKGEGGSHNRGKTVSYLDPIAMGRPKDELYTGCVRGDHIYLHPDPQVNEMWLSCNSSFEIVVWDPVKKEVKTRIPNPDGGSTHSGAFVQYAVDASGNWKGEVLSDHGGLYGAALATKARMAAEAAAKKR